MFLRSFVEIFRTFIELFRSYYRAFLDLFLERFKSFTELFSLSHVTTIAMHRSCKNTIGQSVVDPVYLKGAQAGRGVRPGTFFILI